MTCKDGSVRYVEIFGAPIGDMELVLLQDVTERKWAEEALSKNLAILEKSQEIGHLGSWSLDCDSEMFEVSEEIFRIYGLQSRGWWNPQRTKYWKRIHPDDLERYRDYYESVRRDGQLGGLDYRVVWPDGSVHYLHVVTDSIVRGPDDRVKTASGITRT